MALLLFSCQRPTVENVSNYRGSLGVSNLFESFFSFFIKRLKSPVHKAHWLIVLKRLIPYYP
jgi:hypothetical protein